MKWMHTFRTQFLVALLTVVAPLVGLLFCINTYSMNVIRDEAVHSYNNLTTMNIESIDLTLQEASDLLENIALNNAHISSLKLKKYGSTSYIYAKYMIMESTVLKAAEQWYIEDGPAGTELYHEGGRNG
ncbi:hypothetical protein [Paenibacillus sp.]|uniref:hypothetical protein n=1 Tax=Paenibacillus sp. TaxID=58172 RepID=UPI002D5C9463|nr:hypothetical protein [Paenibacillus sp.]HZG85955.1 hypothetical protein [Paenibacillus sp.]